MLEQLRTYILADATLAGLISARFYPGRVPANAVNPHCSYRVVDEEVLNTHGDDAKQLETWILQIDAYADSYTSAQTVKDALKARLNSASFVQDEIRFGYIEWQGSFDDFEDETNEFRQTITISVMWSEVE